MLFAEQCFYNDKRPISLEAQIKMDCIWMVNDLPFVSHQMQIFCIRLSCALRRSICVEQQQQKSEEIFDGLAKHCVRMCSSGDEMFAWNHVNREPHIQTVSLQCKTAKTVYNQQKEEIAIIIIRTNLKTYPGWDKRDDDYNSFMLVAMRAQTSANWQFYDAKIHVLKTSITWKQRRYTQNKHGPAPKNAHGIKRDQTRPSAEELQKWAGTEPNRTEPMEQHQH